MSTTWSGDWQSRLLARLSELGFRSVHELLLNRDGVPYEDVAAELGPGFAPVQLVIVHLQSCADRGCFVDAAAECLARTLMSQLKRGWGKGIKSEYRAASALAEWLADVSHTVQTEMSRADFEAIKRALRDEVRPPVGWLPNNGDDPLIRRAFELALNPRENL